MRGEPRGASPPAARQSASGPSGRRCSLGGCAPGDQPQRWLPPPRVTLASGGGDGVAPSAGTPRISMGEDAEPEAGLPAPRGVFGPAWGSPGTGKGEMKPAGLGVQPAYAVCPPYSRRRDARPLAAARHGFDPDTDGCPRRPRTARGGPAGGSDGSRASGLG